MITLLWLGMTYEGSRNMIGGAGNSQHATTLQEEIRAYENVVAGGVDYQPRNANTSSYHRRTSDASDAPARNFFSRLGRNVGRFLQTAVRETLRAFVRFFDGVIS